VLQLSVYGPSSKLTEVGADLEDAGHARHVALAPGIRDGQGLLTAEVDRGSADSVLQFLSELGLPSEQVALSRLDDVGTLHSSAGVSSLIWADVLGQARQNARPVARYLVYMIAAGVIAAFGVIDDNQTLIVGAMAVSPDFLPIAAVCVGLVGLRWRLTGRALLTLILGLGATASTAALLTAVLNWTGDLPSDFHVGEGALMGLVTVNSATIGVALAAGVAGMLSLETRASAAVGVAISVTTIPAAAYLGAAAGLGELDKAWGALGVLAVNVVTLQVGGISTLLFQRRLTRPPPRPAPGQR
jgi:uncharacterized hydrophobic protein (TIGR00271 family)